MVFTGQNLGDQDVKQQNDSDIKAKLLAAILPHVAFDGWSDTAFNAACNASNVEIDFARLICPAGSLDLAVLFHRNGDTDMQKALKHTNMSQMRFREKVSLSVRLRLETIEDKEAVRRGITLFALPHNASLGTRLIWETADCIWIALDDTSRDINWYTKRATLSAVYSSTILYWLGDDSLGHERTWDFLDRRIENVMAIEKFKSKIQNNQVLNKLMIGPNWVMGQIKAPVRKRPDNMPGYWNNS